ncbi:aldo/keto reductase [Nocardia brevicatena]|uniref:aldo/keto reductase n=1 Tax=Nocardia brevicatena TaxID=37327 RepID=UPI0002ED7126|nr:aldo/keto reductase [Nocardia brevicatena]
MDITRLGFGSWAVSGSGWTFGRGATDDAESVAAIRHALDAGVNWIDTAAVYGLGHSEELVGKAISGLPQADRPYIFTKVGLVWDPENPSAAPRRIMKPAGVRHEVEDSLRRLGVDHIDLCQVHCPDTGESLEYSGGGFGAVSPNATPLEEYWQVMADLKAKGKVRAIGLSNHTPDLLEAAEQITHVDVIRPPFSAINRSSAAEIAWARARDRRDRLLAAAARPAHRDLSAECVAGLPADDWRTAHHNFTTGLTANLQLTDTLRPIAARHGATVAEVAIAWVPAWPGITGAIVGAHRSNQVDGWIGADSVALTPSDLAEIAAITASGAGAGPAQP